MICNNCISATGPTWCWYKWYI